MDGVRDGLTSVVVVAADSGPLLLQCVDRVLASSAPIEIVIVDNASADGIPARAAFAHDARVRLIANPANRGFGPACNQGAAAAGGDALLFLNPDCLIERETITALRTVAGADRSLGLVGADVRTPEGASARGNRRRDPTLRRALMAMSGLTHFESRWPALAGVELPKASAKAKVERVDAVSGACMFVPRSVFDAVGGFDEAYFLHVEDLDLCRRVRDGGYAVAIANDVHVVHAQGSSSVHRPVFVAAHKRRGMWRYFTKYDRSAQNPLLRAIVWTGLWARFALSATAALWPPSRNRAR